MHASFILRQFACRVTLFTRDNCSLCTDAKAVLSKVWDRRPFEYDEINVMAIDQKIWRDAYEFDTPVVGERDDCIKASLTRVQVHVDKTKEGNMRFTTSKQALKLMHRFKEDEIEKLMDKAMLSPSSS